MTDYDDLIRFLTERDQCCANTDNIYRAAMTAIEELVAERDMARADVSSLTTIAQSRLDRAEKAEAALASARSALRHFADSLADMHGGDHHDDGCPDCAAMIEHAPAIAAARAEGGE
jgi:hypothetical protein